MRENDTPLIRAMDVPVALVLLTRLPLPSLPKSAFERQAQAAWAFPLVGLVVGCVAALVALIGLGAGLSAGVVAGLCLAAQIVVTGAMHEDGLADTADGFWGGWTHERRLEIMKDSQIGTYGVLALILSVGLRWSALTVILQLGVWPILAVAVLSRAALPLMMRLPQARPGGLSDSVGQPPLAAAGVSLAIGLGALVLIAGGATAPLILAAILATTACAALARAKIGGQTGDVLGATQQVTEISALLALALLA